MNININIIEIYKKFKIHIFFSIIIIILFLFITSSCIGGGGTDWNRGFIEALYIYFGKMGSHIQKLNIVEVILMLPLSGEICYEGLHGQLMIITTIFALLYYNIILFVLLKIIKIIKNSRKKGI